jgi:hypothetical protein
MRRLAKGKHAVRAKVVASQLATTGSEKLMMLYKNRSLWVSILAHRRNDSPKVSNGHLWHCRTAGLHDGRFDLRVHCACAVMLLRRAFIRLRRWPTWLNATPRMTLITNESGSV